MNDIASECVNDQGGGDAVQASEPEGLGESRTWGDYPLDDLRIRPDRRTIHGVMQGIDQKTYVMNPEFQRDVIWSEDKQSKLIESVTMRIPLPVFYLAENQDGQMVVVDGLQRLFTFRRFIRNELRLMLPHRDELDGQLFEDLPPKIQNRVEDCDLILYIIEFNVPERVRLDIFERVNSGVPLTRQQMRNSLYMGKATSFLKEEVSTKIFLDATGGFYPDFADTSEKVDNRPNLSGGVSCRSVKSSVPSSSGKPSR